MEELNKCWKATIFLKPCQCSYNLKHSAWFDMECWEKKKDDGRNSEAEKNWHCPFHLKQNELISETSNMNWFVIWKTDCKWELDKCSISFFFVLFSFSFFQKKLGFAFLILVIIRLVILMTPKLAWRQPLSFHYTSYTNVKIL